MLVWYEGSGTADRRWLHADERGVTIAISDASGNVTSVLSYDDYGTPAATNVGRFQYTGQAWLPELGMSYSEVPHRWWLFGPQSGSEREHGRAKPRQRSA